MTVVPCKYSCPMSHNGCSHFHQLWHFTLFSLANPIQHYFLRLFLVDLCPELPQLLFEVICLRQRLVHVQSIVKPRFIFLVKDVLSIAQQEVSRTFENLPLVDVLFHVILHPAYVIQLFVHELDNVEMIIFLQSREKLS